MNKSNSRVSLYNKHKEEQYNYRLAQDLQKHNWLLKKLESADTKPTKREKNILKRLSKKMEDHSGKVVTPKMVQKKQSCNTIKKLQKINSNNKSAGQSMPDITDHGTTKNPYTEKEPVEPLGVLRITGLKRSEIIAKPRKPHLNKTPLVGQSEEGQHSAGNNNAADIINMEANNNKHISLSVPASQPKNWFETKEEILSKHNLPLEIAPEMKKNRDLHQPAKNEENQKVCHESQSPGEDMMMLKLLHDKDINTVEKLIDIIESRTTKINEEDSKIIDHDTLKEEIREEEVKLQEKESHEVEFVMEEIFPKKEVSPEAVDAAVALSTENKKLLNLCSSKTGFANILKLIADSNYNEQDKNKLEEVLRAQTNQLTITTESVSVTDTQTINKNKMPQPQHKISQNFYGSTENQEMDEDNDNLVIEVNNNQVVEVNNNQVLEVNNNQVLEVNNNQVLEVNNNQVLEVNNNQVVEDYQGSEYIGNQLVDAKPQVRDDIASHNVEDMGYQVANDSNSQIVKDKNNSDVNRFKVPVVEDTIDLQTQEKLRREVSQDSSISAFISAVNDIPKSTKVDGSLSVTEEIPYKRRRMSQMEEGTRQIVYPPENKRLYQYRDPRYTNRPQDAEKPEHSNQFGTHRPPGFLSLIRPASFSNSNAGLCNQTPKIPNNGIGPYHRSNLNYNSIVSGSPCGRNPASFLNSPNENNKNIAADRMSKYPQYGNTAAYAQNNNNHTIIYPHSQHNNYNSNSQGNVTCSHSDNLFNPTSRNNISSGVYAQISPMGLGDLSRVTHNNFHNSLNVNSLHNTPFTFGARPHGPNSNNDPRRLAGPNFFWGSVRHSLPPTTFNNSVAPQMQWRATPMGNLIGSTGITPVQYTPAPPSSKYTYGTE